MRFQRKTPLLTWVHVLPAWRFVRQCGGIVQVSALCVGSAVLIMAVLILVSEPLRDQAKQAFDAARQALATPEDADGFAELPWAEEGATEDPADAADLARAYLFTPQDDGRAVLEALRHDFYVIQHRGSAIKTLAGMSATQFQAVRKYLANKYRVSRNTVGAIIHTAHAVGQYRGVDPQLLLAIIAIESRYNPLAESHVGAQGLMQVMPRVHRDKFAALGLEIDAAVEAVPNMLVGAQIYQDCKRRRGTAARALSCYVGATGPSDGGYSAKVLAELQRIARVSGITPTLE